MLKPLLQDISHRQLRTHVILSLLSVSIVGNACSPHLGWRPDPPAPVADPNLYYNALRSWGEDLAIAYDSRASANRYALYAAGFVALSGTTALGILNGINNVSSGTNVGVSLGTGFVTALTGLFDNKTLAEIYTRGANELRRRLVEAETARHGTGSNISQVAAQLYRGIYEVITEVETRRTELSRGVTLPCVVQIKGPPNNSVRVNETFPFTASGQKGSVMWFLSANRSGGSIDFTGLYRAGSQGAVRDAITAMDLGGGCIHSTIEINVQ